MARRAADEAMLTRNGAPPPERRCVIGARAITRVTIAAGGVSVGGRSGGAARLRAARDQAERLAADAAVAGIDEVTHSDAA
jgi:hypothetical protein